MEIDIPGSGMLTIETIILDVNGTLTIDGEVIEGVTDRLQQLCDIGLRIVMFSADTRGTAEKTARDLGIEFVRAKDAEEKATEAGKLNPETCVGIGNGLIDLKKMELVKLGIVTLQAEGAHTKTILAADLVVPSINDALDLLLKPERLIASLRS